MFEGIGNQRKCITRWDHQYIYILISVEPGFLFVWKFDTSTLDLSRILVTHDDLNVELKILYTSQNHLYAICQFANRVKYLARCDIVNNSFRHIVIFDQPETINYMRLFEFNGQLYIIMQKNQKNIEIHCVENDTLVLIHIEIREDTYNEKTRIVVSNNQLYVFNYNYQQINYMGILTLDVLDFATFEWTKLDMKQIVTSNTLREYFIIDDKIHAIECDFSGRYAIYVGMNVDSLELYSLLQVANIYKIRLGNGDNIHDLIEEIDRLQVPDKMRKTIRDMTVWKLHWKRQKMRRATRKETLKKLNDPLSVQDEEMEEECDEEEFDLPIDVIDTSGDGKLYWNYSFPLSKPNNINLEVKSTKLHDKIWALNKKKCGESCPPQLYCFDPKTEKWNRVFFKFEEMFLNKTEEERKLLSKEYQIPLSCIRFSFTSCNNKLYLWAQITEIIGNLYEFDTENATWSLALQLAFNASIIHMKGYKDQLHFHKDYRHKHVSVLNTHKMAIEYEYREKTDCVFVQVGDRVFIVRQHQGNEFRHLYEFVDGDFNFIHTEDPYADSEMDSINLFASDENIYQLVESSDEPPRLFLDFLNISSLTWSRVEMDNEESLIGYDHYAIGKTIYNVWYPRITVAIAKMELNPSSTTRYLMKAADRIMDNISVFEQETMNLSGKMKKQLKNMLELRRTNNRDDRWNGSEIDDAYREDCFEILDEMEDM